MKTLLFQKKDFPEIPQDTGVYFFLKERIPLYIGKAINLKARIASHMRSSTLDQKESLIISQADHIKIIITSSEFNALLLEAQLIKQYKPKYNVTWKDGKSSLYIKITQGELYPKIFAVRFENDATSLYFGPFHSTHIVNQLLREIRTIIPFCTQKKITAKTCFYSKIGLCDPCPNNIAHMNDKTIKKKLTRQYRTQIRKIILILKGKSDIVLQSLVKIMTQMSKEGAYEQAIKIRDRIAFLRKLIVERSFHENTETGLIGFRREKLLNEFRSFMLTYFKISHVHSTCVIECYDVSHLFGDHATASLVVFKEGQPSKKEYKRFRIKTVHQISDTDMIKEVMTRRFKRTEWSLPDLIIVDGGRPQLSAVSSVMQDQKIHIPCIGFAKNPDRIIIGHPMETIYLSHHSTLLLLFKYIRDESHRFAKKYHIHLKNKNLFSYR